VRLGAVVAGRHDWRSRTGRPDEDLIAMPRLQAKRFAHPDDVRTLPRAEFATVGLDDATCGALPFRTGLALV
jgi:hypothetical protein